MRKEIIYLLEAPEMEENDIDNDNIDNNNVNNNAVNNAARIRPTRPRCSPGPLFFFGCVGLSCLLVGSFAMLIAGSYFYSIYNQSSGIEYQATICVFGNSWYEATNSDTYDVKADVTFAINGETLQKTMLYNNYADRHDADLISLFLPQYSPNITCYYHPNLDGPVRAPIDVHQNYVFGVGLLVPSIVVAVLSIVGITLICVIGKKQTQVQNRHNRRFYEQRVEAEQRR